MPQPLKLSTPAGEVSGALQVPDQADALLVFAHGAGAGFDHKNMVSIADAWSRVGLATLRYNFPFIEAGERRVDSKEVTLDCIEAAVSFAGEISDLPVLLAGHSFGGRMNSHAWVERGVRGAGLIFCSFPLHGPKKPKVDRAAHLPEIDAPMLFLSGTRDDLADAQLLQQTVSALPQASLHWLETANHSYTVLKRTRTKAEDVFSEMAGYTADFVQSVLAA